MPERLHHWGFDLHTAAALGTSIIAGFSFQWAPLLWVLFWLNVAYLGIAFIATCIEPAHDFREVLAEGGRRLIVLIIVQSFYFGGAHLPALMGVDQTLPLGSIAAGWFIADTFLRMIDRGERVNIPMGPLSTLARKMRGAQQDRIDPPIDNSNLGAGGSVVSPRT